MTIADITLAAFTICNSVRVVAYVPQITKAATDQDGAQAISFTTWGLFLLSNASAVAYALVNKADWMMASMFLGQCRRLRRDPPGRGLEAHPTSRPASARGRAQPAPLDANTWMETIMNARLRHDALTTPVARLRACRIASLRRWPHRASLGRTRAATRRWPRPARPPPDFADGRRSRSRFAASPTNSWRRQRRATR